MLFKSYYLPTEKWTGAYMEVHVDFDKSDGSVNDYRFTIIEGEKSIDVTKLFITNWPVLVNDILQQTDLEKSAQ